MIEEKIACPSLEKARELAKKLARETGKYFILREETFFYVEEFKFSDKEYEI